MYELSFICWPVRDKLLERYKLRWGRKEGGFFGIAETETIGTVGQCEPSEEVKTGGTAEANVKV
jgi:hypothetical protein